VVAAAAGGRRRPLAAFANDPLAGRLAGRLVPDLKRRLEERLPAAMVPADFVLLKELPLTANGKLDRRRLPGRERRRPDLGSAATAPRTSTEARLLEIWNDVLGLEGVGVEDNFFELGGHSLLATQVVSRIRHDLGSEIALRRLFENPTISELAAAIDEGELRATGTTYTTEDFEEIVL
jgi:acyl carrier protein